MSVRHASAAPVRFAVSAAKAIVRAQAFGAGHPAKTGLTTTTTRKTTF